MDHPPCQMGDGLLRPIVGYLYAREVEAEALRLIFGALAGGFEAELPEIYT